VSRARTGREAESLVALHLEKNGYEILARNARVGRLELDVIARRGALVVFVEVRSRTTDRFGSPLLTLNRAKLGRLRRAAARWLKENRPGTTNVRFDAAAVVFDRSGVNPPKLTYYERAF
jgi:putative endonuclease